MSDDSFSLDPRNLIVNYIPTPVTDDVLRSLFEPFGAIETARVIIDKNTGHPKGYGFVKFTEVDAALMAMEKMNGFELQNKRLKVTTARGPTASVGNPVYAANPTSNYDSSILAAPQKAPTQNQVAHNVQPQPLTQQPAAVPQPMYPQAYPGQAYPGYMPTPYPQPMMMPYQPQMYNNMGFIWVDPTTGRQVMPMMAPMGGMGGMMPTPPMGMVPPGFAAPISPHPDGQLPAFVQSVAQEVRPAEGEQNMGKGSMNMTLMGVSGLGTPNASIDGKASNATMGQQQPR